MAAPTVDKHVPLENETLQRHRAMYERRLRELARIGEVDDSQESTVSQTEDENEEAEFEDLAVA